MSSVYIVLWIKRSTKIMCDRPTGVRALKIQRQRGKPLRDELVSIVLRIRRSTEVPCDRPTVVRTLNKQKHDNGKNVERGLSAYSPLDNTKYRSLM